MLHQPEPAPPRALTLPEQARLARLGVTVPGVARCKGYQHCCVCPACQAKATAIRDRGFTPDGKIVPPPAPQQPWEPVRRAA